jgi:hypothetical protein
MTTYSQKLKDPRWQKKRLYLLDAAEWECFECGDKSQTLNVHHKSYLKGRDPWDYPPDYYVVLCDDCHKHYHLTQDYLNLILNNFGIHVQWEIIGDLEGSWKSYDKRESLRNLLIMNDSHALGIAQHIARCRGIARHSKEFYEIFSEIYFYRKNNDLPHEDKLSAIERLS